MKKYQIIWAHRDKKNDEVVGNAATKPSSDVAFIAHKCGYAEKYVIIPCVKNKLLDVIVRLHCLISVIRSCEKGSVILLQYPCFNERVFQYAKFFLKGRKLITVVHDMNSIREAGTLSKAEIASLSVFSEIIVHSPEMKQYLSPYFSNVIKFHILGCFPYLSSSECETPSFSNEVCFAGNIDKSVFLTRFFPIIRSLKLKLFGRMEHSLELNDRVEYCGMFKPDNIEALRGSWGLVWDGESLDSCSGTWGEYLRIIAPHKFSLYIAAGIPVIVWDKSAMARIVREKGIGLTVSSLNELEEIIANVSAVEYGDFISHLHIVSQEVRDGKMLNAILNECGE